MHLSPYGVLQLPVWGCCLVTFLTIQSMFLGVTLYLHRDQSHGGLILHPPLRHLFRFWLWFSSGAVTREWVAVHRCHHAHADQAGDPHSPLLFGVRRVLLEGFELYRTATRDEQLLNNYGRGTPDDWLERRLYSAHPYLGIVLFVLAHLIVCNSIETPRHRARYSTPSRTSPRMPASSSAVAPFDRMPSIYAGSARCFIRMA